MAVAIKSLVDGTIPTTGITALYTVATGKSILVKSMRLVNSGTAEATINLYFNNGTDRRRILPKDVKLPVGFSVIDDAELALEVGEKIEASSNATSVEYVFSGVERDAV